MSREFYITIPSNATQATKNKLRVEYSRTDLINDSVKLWDAPYTNPQGEDGKSLKCTPCKSVGGNLLEDAVQFFFDFKKEKAVFTFNPNRVKPSGDKGLFEFELKGKYKFEDTIRISWEKDSVVKSALFIEQDAYELGSEKTKIGYIELKPKASDDGLPDIKVKLSLSEELKPCLSLDRDEITIEMGRSEKVFFSVVKEYFKHLPKELIKGFFHIQVENITKDRYEKFAIGSTNQISQTNVNRLKLIENKYLSISAVSDEDDFFDEENPISVYISQKPIEKKISIRTKKTGNNSVAYVDTTCGDDKVLITSSDFKKEIPLMENTPRDIQLLIAPNDEKGIISQTIKLESDYSLPCIKKIYIQTKEQLEPSGYLDFKFSNVNDDDNPEPYYIGSGKVMIGELTVKNAMVDDPRYRDLVLPPDCNCKNIVIEKKGNDNLSYAVYLNIPESDIVETDEDNKLTLIFSCDNLQKIERGIEIKKREVEPIVIDFQQKENIVYKCNDIIPVGSLIIDYSPKMPERYICRNERFLQVDTTDVLQIGEDTSLSKIPIEKGTIPVYCKTSALFGNQKNIDEIMPVKIELKYSDSIEEREVPFEFQILPITANPKPNVYVRCRRDNEEVWANGNFNKDNRWTYQFDSRARENARRAIIGIVSFENTQDIPYKSNGVLFRNIELSGNYLDVSCEETIQILNGDNTPREIPIEIIYNQIPLVGDKSTTLHIKYDVTTNEGITPVNCDIPITVIECVTDDWYSLDLGTTGIVVARWNAKMPDDTTPINLHDAEPPIEDDATIVSSKTILMDYKHESENDEDNDEEHVCECVVRPSSLDFKQKATFVLVPSKFLVGQDEIPFVDLYINKYKDGIRIGTGKYKWDKIEPKTILKHTYSKIFDMVDNDCRKSIRKLIVTYPNTYTPSALGWLRNTIISPEEVNPLFPMLTHENLHFIPESDAVVAFYVNQEINGVIPMNDTENIIIYDMGAGTLDLSYVCIENKTIEGKNKRHATILKRIGIPIAGEFFSFLLYKQLEGKFGSQSMTTIKEWIEILKKGFDSEKKYKELNYKGSVFSNAEDANGSMEIGEELERWLDICSNEIFVQLLGQEWKSTVDKIVFSGRGSQFEPLKKAIESEINGSNINTITISSDCLKQCVAKGALLYQRIFENTNMPFEIVHKNTYLNLGIRYRVLDNFRRTWKYEELIGIMDYTWDDKSINGAIHAVVNDKSIPVDLSQDADVTFYLTPLSENEMRDLMDDTKNCKWCFVNELFKLNPSFIDADDRANAKMNISMDKDNHLSIVLNGNIDLLQHTTAPNVEDNKYFSSCNDYLNKKNN